MTVLVEITFIASYIRKKKNQPKMQLFVTQQLNTLGGDN